MYYKSMITLTLVILMSTVLDELTAQEKPEGFIIEVVDQDTTLSYPASIDYIRSLTTDTIIVNDKEGNPVSWIGVQLLTVIEKRTGINFNRIEKLIANAPDGYNSVISGDLLPELKSAYLVYDLVNSDKWLKKYGQVRLIYTNLREMYYVSNPEKIIIHLLSEKLIYNNLQFYFLGKGSLSGFSVNDTVTQAGIKIDDLLSVLKLSGRNFTLLTTDSLQREYLYNDVTQLMVLKIDDKGTWKITGKKVPVGLRTRNIFYLQSGDVSFFLKSLSDEEILLWENYLNKSFLEDKDFRIELVLTGGERIPVEQDTVTGIYKSIIDMVDKNPEAAFVELISAK